MRYTNSFGHLLKKDSVKFGGKAAMLGDMAQASLPIPNGFGISIEAQREFINKPFTKDFKDELQQAFEKTGAKRVAVRSSAIAEDSENASWAGQLESFLNITANELEESIRKCWDSILSAHAKEYAKDKDLNDDDLLVGVAVQAMVDSDVSGVMFTANPVTKDMNEIVIEGAYGLGESIVQGIVTPDNYLVNKKLLIVSQFNINIKDKMFIFNNGSNQLVSVPKDIADKSVLRENQVIELAKLGKIIEKKYKKPQDIEWAFVAGKFYILQCRPITTL